MHPPQSSPGSRWLIDVATLDAKMPDGRRPRLAVVMDVSTRRIIASHASPDAERAVKMAVRTAVAGSGKPEVVLVDGGVLLPELVLAELDARIEVMGAFEAARRGAAIEHYIRSLRDSFEIGGAA